MSNRTLLYSREQIAQRVSDLGRQISDDYKKVLKPGEQLLVIGVLNGAFIFLADLTRALEVETDIDFIRLSSYQDRDTTSSQVIMTKSLEKEIKDRHVLVVEDIADCGLTLAWLLEYLGERKPASLKVAVAIDKTVRRQAAVPLDYVGFTVEDGFLIGYGLDYAERYRTLPDIYEIETKS